MINYLEIKKLPTYINRNTILFLPNKNSIGINFSNVKGAVDKHLNKLTNDIRSHLSGRDV